MVHSFGTVANMNNSNLDPALQAQGQSTPQQQQPQAHLPPPPQQYGAPPPPPQQRNGSGVNEHYDSRSQPLYNFYTSPVADNGDASNQASPATGGFGLTSPHQEGTQNAEDAKRPRACEACRGLKVRCDQDPAHPEIPCKRCAKAGRQCVITQPSRKRQKKADSRVAELERKLDALTAALQGQGNGAGWGGGGGGQVQVHGQRDDGGGVKRRRLDEEEFEGGGGESGVQPHLSRATSSSREDPLSREMQEITRPWGPTNDDPRGYLYRTSPEEFVARINSLIGPEMAARVWQRYITDLAPNLPAVVFPPETTPEQVFKEKPILYVCILSAASFGIVHTDVHKALAAEAVGAIADCVVRHGAKSLELIQAMQIIALYYKPPEIAERTNFYQIIHMAAVMALDIGLGKRYNPAKSRRGFGGPNAHLTPGPGRNHPQDSDTLEARRAWLTCYYLCASASMVLRRPNLVRWTNYMRECIEVLESHPDAFSSDKLFVQHVKIQHICEDIGLQFLMDDNTATNISITDPKVTYALTVLENQLKDWKEGIPAEYKEDKGLQFFEQVTSLYLHEIALHFNHNVEDFRLPFTEESLKSGVNASGPSDTLTANQVAALESCLKAAHGVLDVFLSYDQDSVKCLPMLLFFVRCVYAVVILIKMHVAVCTEGSELGKMMGPEDLRVDYYIDALVEKFRYTHRDEGGGEEHPKVMRILGVLKEWYGRHRSAVVGMKREVGFGVGMKRQSDGIGQTGMQMPERGGGDQQQQSQQSRQPSTSWTFDTPGVVDYGKQPHAYHPDNLMSKWKGQQRQEQSSTPQQPQQLPPTPQQQQRPDGSFGFLPPEHQNQQAMLIHANGMNFGSNGGAAMVDPNNTSAAEFGWGSGFEQAMDMALGGVDGLQGGGLDNWFLGDGMAPFAFQGDLGVGGTGGTGSW